jgi:hypothetical protein
MPKIFGILLLATGAARAQIGAVSSPPPAPPAAPCTGGEHPHSYTVTTYANVNTYSEQMWIIDGSQNVESGIIVSYTTTTMEICLSTGTHTLKLIDTFGDGWTSGSYVSIVETQTGLPILDNAVLETGYDTTYSFWVGDMPLHPPSPPRDPPGVVKHEMCHLLIRGVRDPSAMMVQVAEVVIMDPTGTPLPVLDAYSDCEPVTWEMASMAVDSNEYTKWLCTPFSYGNGTATCTDECIGTPSWGSDGYCDDGGPGAEYSGCTVGTDCTDCGPRCEGGGSDCGDGATITIDFEGHHSIGSYHLMTANDYPERDPTNWTLSCIDRDGNMTVMSEVDGVVPPDERSAIYGTQNFFPAPPAPPPMPPQEPSPPSPPPPSTPPPGAPCFPVTIITVTTNWASEQSWTVNGPSGQILTGSGYTNYNTETTDACMEPGA